MFKEICCCRNCNSENLSSVLSLGNQFLTGVFPKNIKEDITSGPLELVWCHECGLLQMKYTYSPDEMYGENYGYRSGLNSSMVNHLTNKVRFLERLSDLREDDLVIDVGSNDGTSLKAYTTNCKKVGIDPTGLKFKKYYPDNIHLIPDFFSAKVIRDELGDVGAKIITSIAMFYDLESPQNFVRDISELLTVDGIWHFEQSYMPSMLRMNAYDTICHEHIEFYSFGVVKDMLEKNRMRVVDVQMNSINGGSFAVTACKEEGPYQANDPIINWLLEQEKDMGLYTPKPYREFEERVFKHKKDLKDLIVSLAKNGKKVFGYGASTKGNVLLQFCGLSVKEIPYIAEINDDKYGAYTPGTHIPIVSEEEAFAMKPDYFLVLPWHFKNSILEREKEYINGGGKFIFPLPEIEIV